MACVEFSTDNLLVSSARRVASAARHPAPAASFKALLLASALRQAEPGTRRHEFLQRLGRSLDQFGSLTPANAGGRDRDDHGEVEPVMREQTSSNAQAKPSIARM
jgi:hypothetical protein